MLGPFKMRGREYDARCTHVGDHVIETKSGEKEERGTLQIVLLKVSPSDLAQSPLKQAAFIETLEPQQVNLSEIVSDDEEERAELIFDAKHKVMALAHGTRRDEDCSFNIRVTPIKGPLKDNAAGGTLLLRPRNGIVIKEIAPTAVCEMGKPTVEIKLSVKGLHFGVKGYGWREDDFTLSFEEKASDELLEDTPQPKKRGRPKKDDKQMSLEDYDEGDDNQDEEPEEEAGPEDEVEAPVAGAVEVGVGGMDSDDGRQDAAGAKQTVYTDDISVGELNALPTGVIVQFKHAAFIRRTGLSAGFENQSTKQLCSATELLEKHAGQPVTVHAAKRIKLPDWAEGVRVVR